MGKAEGRDDQWHGHVTALSVAPSYRYVDFFKENIEMLALTSLNVEN